MRIIKTSIKKAIKQDRSRQAIKKRHALTHHAKVVKLRKRQDLRKYMQRKELLAKLDVEDLKEKYLLSPWGYRKLQREDKMAIETIIALSLNEPVYEPQDLADTIVDYFREVDNAITKNIANNGKVIELDNRRPYTIEGLCNYLCLTKRTFNEYCSQEKYKDYHYVCNLAKQMIVQKVLEGGLMKELDSQLAKFYLKNVSDLSDDSQVKASTSGNSIVFVSVGNKEELKELNEGTNGFNGEIVEAECIEESNNKQSI